MGKTILCCALASWAAAGCETNGPWPDNTPLAGLWSVQRGALHVKFTWTASGGGETESDSTESELGALDPADFPEALGPLVEQWNTNLAAVNAELDAALPDQVMIEFPSFATIRVTNVDDETATGQGLINQQDEFLFIGDLSGAGEGDDAGGGALLDASSIDGSFDRDELSMNGKIARTLVVLLGNQDGAVALTVQVSVDFSGERTGDLPEDMPDAMDDEMP